LVQADSSHLRQIYPANSALPQAPLRNVPISGTFFAALYVGKSAHVYPHPDPDVRAVRQDISKSIEALEKQIKLLAQRLLLSPLRLNELEAERQKIQKIYRDPK
jgi:hypothetical protein